MKEEVTLEDKLRRLQELVGTFHTSKIQLVNDCLDEDEAGVWRLATRINLNQGTFSSPTAVFIKSLMEGMHKSPVSSPPRNPRHLPYPRVGPEENARFKGIAKDWETIQKWMSHPRIKALFHEMQASCKDPSNPTHAEGTRTRTTLLYAIRNPPA